MENSEGIALQNPELEMLKLTKDSAYNYRRRRHDIWTEIYDLYRLTIKTNRLTQRQTVILPLMKQTINSILKDIDDMPVVYFENLDNDKDAEIFQNEYWKYTIGPQCNNMDVKDSVDKRQELLAGRTFDQMQIVDGKILMTIVPVEDIYVNRYTDPTTLDGTRDLIHTHIFKPLSSLTEDSDLDQAAVKRLQEYYATEQGLVKAKQNEQMYIEKNQKMADLGVQDAQDPVLGETYVELTLYFVYRESETYTNGEGKKVTVKDQYIVYTEADEREILMKKPLEQIIDPEERCSDHYWRTHLPYNSWAEETDIKDFWTDGKGDFVRPQNKILNVWCSQLVENRTLRSYGMNYYDATIEDFQPPSIEPEPWGWVAVPGKPQDVFQKVDIPDLSESLNEMKFVVDINDRGSGANATGQGVQAERQITLGEVKLALAETKELNRGISKYYTAVWMKRAEKFLKLIEANPDRLDAVTIYREGRNTNDIYSRDIAPKDWMTKTGYRVKIWNQQEKTAEDQQELQVIMAIAPTFAGNNKFEDKKERKLLEFAKFKPDEINEIVTEQSDRRQQMAQMAQLMGGAAGGQPGSTQPALPAPQPGLPTQ